MPAAAVIPAPGAYIKFVAVKTLVFHIAFIARKVILKKRGFPTGFHFMRYAEKKYLQEILSSIRTSKKLQCLKYHNKAWYTYITYANRGTSTESLYA